MKRISTHVNTEKGGRFPSGVFFAHTPPETAELSQRLEESTARSPRPQSLEYDQTLVDESWVPPSKAQGGEHELYQESCFVSV